MKYVSTRGAHKEGVSSAYAIKTGLASDGGLFMPETIPSINLDFIKELSALTYEERAARVLSLFLTDYTYEELLADASGAYSSEKFTPSAAPISKIGEKTYMLEKRRYLRPLQDGTKYEVCEEIKKEVLFRQLNLMDVFPFRRKMHIVFLRNVMIYFDKETKRQLIQKVYECMEPGGYLFIGQTETIDKGNVPFEMIRPSIFRKTGG